jgi:predicted transcriptional regulator
MKNRYKTAKNKVPPLIMPVTIKPQFKKRIHEVASKRYSTAAAYVREAIIEKMKREGDWSN